MFLVCVSDQVRRLDESLRSRSEANRRAVERARRVSRLTAQYRQQIRPDRVVRKPSILSPGGPINWKQTREVFSVVPAALFSCCSLFLVACAVVGGLFGPGAERVRLPSSNASSSSEEDLKASLKSFTKVYDVVEENFADKVSADKAIYKGAIPGMLRTLDPHSNFFDPKDFAALREDQRGHYYGVGMTVGPQPRNGKTDRDRSVWRIAGVQSRHPSRRRDHGSERQERRHAQPPPRSPIC